MINYIYIVTLLSTYSCNVVCMLLYVFTLCYNYNYNINTTLQLYVLNKVTIYT